MSNSRLMSVAQHVQNVVMSCAQTVPAYETVRAHGMTNSTLCRWSTDQLLLLSWSTLRCTSRRRTAGGSNSPLSGLCSTDQVSVSELVDDADDALLTHLHATQSDSIISCFLCLVTVVIACDTDTMIENSFSTLKCSGIRWLHL